MINQAQLDRLCINTIRTLSIDAIQKAQSGHPGTPMGAAPTVYCLWQRFLRFDPEDANWANRDRFVLSNGHASAMLYSLLYLAGEKIRTILTKAPGNGALIGGLKVIAESGWFATRPSGTEDIYKIYTESFSGADHLHRFVDEAQIIVNDALG